MPHKLFINIPCQIPASLVTGGFSDPSLKVWEMSKLWQQAVNCKSIKVWNSFSVMCANIYWHKDMSFIEDDHSVNLRFWHDLIALSSHFCYELAFKELVTHCDKEHKLRSSFCCEPEALDIEKQVQHSPVFQSLQSSLLFPQESVLRPLCPGQFLHRD
ncbi:hypothetical protein NC651_012899 [Populus alba x Populus x berolinensis]|nr:hypothetical protein NC651_012899 [Populus alba x Populus x berolinensis]